MRDSMYAIMAKLIWDGDEEREEEPEEISPDDESAEIEEVDIAEVSDDPDGCSHPWQEVSRETMKRVVRGSTIDTQDIYWCNSCKSILDVIE